MNNCGECCKCDLVFDAIHNNVYLICLETETKIPYEMKACEKFRKSAFDSEE